MRDDFVVGIFATSSPPERALELVEYAVRRALERDLGILRRDSDADLGAARELAQVAGVAAHALDRRYGVVAERAPSLNDRVTHACELITARPGRAGPRSTAAGQCAG